MSKTQTIRQLSYAAICITLALVLSQIRLFTMPQGGEVTACSMLFIVLVGYWFGPKTGITAGLAYGILRLFLGAYIIHPVQLGLDYLLPSAALGAFGFLKSQKWGLHFAYLMGAACVFLGSLISGIVFFSSYAPEGRHVVLYSAIYNLSYILPEVAITLVLISLPQVRGAIEHISLRVGKA